jgi:hypothetical protein
MLIEDVIFCSMLFVFIIIGQYITYKTIGTTIKQNKIYLKETSFYGLGKKYVRYVKLIKNKKHERDEILIGNLALEMHEDVKILMKKDE